MLLLGRLALASVLGHAEPAPAPKDAAALYKEANHLRDSGDLAGAARAYARAHVLLRGSSRDDSNALDSLLETGEVAIQAHALRPDGSLICTAERLVMEYEAALAARRLPAVPEVTQLGQKLAVEIDRAGISCEVQSDRSVEPSSPEPSPPADDDLAPVGPPEGRVPVGRLEGPREAAPAPAAHDRRARTLRIGAYASLGGAGVGLVLLAAGAGVGSAVERAGHEQAAQGADASWLQDNFVDRGRTANALLVAGAAVATAATVTAVVLLTKARRTTRTTARLHVTPMGVRF